jgi:predicted amidophosphoribosyltransferase
MDKGKYQILGFIKNNGRVRPVDLARHLNLSRVRIQALLKQLVNAGEISKFGQPPKVYYSQALLKPVFEEIKSDFKPIINSTYVYTNPLGETLVGWTGFEYWAKEINQSGKIESLAREYSQQRLAVDRLINPMGCIDATHKFKQAFAGEWLTKVFYKDTYSLPSFGKTKLGQLVLYAKQSQNRELIKEVANICKSAIKNVVKKYKIQAVAFIPPTIPRQIQFLRELEQYLDLKIPRIKLGKSYPGKTLVAQKTLSRFSERVMNARETIVVEDRNLSFDRVLVIDDAVGSGASLNETAKKLKELDIAKQVYGFAIVGSMKGFEVIQEV